MRRTITLRATPLLDNEPLFIVTVLKVFVLAVVQWLVGRCVQRATPRVHVWEKIARFRFGVWVVLFSFFVQCSCFIFSCRSEFLEISQSFQYCRPFHIFCFSSQSIVIPRRFYWEWLPGFSGVPGRINELGGGEDSFGGSVFIGGEFKPPVLVWRNDPYIGPSTTSECCSPVMVIPWVVG